MDPKTVVENYPDGPPPSAPLWTQFEWIQMKCALFENWTKVATWKPLLRPGEDDASDLKKIDRMNFERRRFLENLIHPLFRRIGMYFPPGEPRKFLLIRGISNAKSDPAGAEDEWRSARRIAQELCDQSVRGLQAGKASVAKPRTSVSVDSQAIAMMIDHPTWSDTQIANAVGCNRTSLYRGSKFGAAKALIREGKIEQARGYLTEAGVEAYDAGDDAPRATPARRAKKNKSH